MTQVDCIITAAGLSSRMGQWKMMLPWRDGTILDASIKNAQQYCSRIILVTGFRADELHDRYRSSPAITLVHNPDFQQGLLTSVLAGASAVESDYCFITHGDLPCLMPEIFSKIWSLREDGAILPHYRGTPGHPILIDSASLRHAASHREMTSMRNILCHGKHRCVEMEYPQIIFDIDTPDDFIRLQATR